MRLNMIKRLFLSLLFVAFSQSTLAEDNYSIKITSTNNGITDTYDESFKDINNLIDASQQTSLDSNLDNYNQNSPAVMDITLGEKDAKITYAEGDTKLVFSMGSINKVFNEGSRAANETAFRKYINHNKDRILQIINGQFFSPPTLLDPPPIGGDSPDDDESGTGFGFSVGHYSVGNQNHNVLTLPLSYTHYYEEEGRKLKLTAPLSYIDINGSKVYKVGLGAAYTRPINERWTIIPSARIGLTASDDMAIGATVVSAYLTNRYEFPYKNKHITLSNMVGVLTSLDYSLGGFDSYYDVNNQVIKNGISIEYPLTYKMFGGKTSMEISLANTQFFGDKVFVDNYTDIALSMGTRRKVGGKDNTQDSIQLGITYTVGNKGYKGGKINFGYKF